MPRYELKEYEVMTKLAILTEKETKFQIFLREWFWNWNDIETPAHTVTNSSIVDTHYPALQITTSNEHPYPISQSRQTSTTSNHRPIKTNTSSSSKKPAVSRPTYYENIWQSLNWYKNILVLLWETFRVFISPIILK